MLATTSLLTSLLFAIIYPFCFLISFKNPIKNNFHHFHLGLPCVIAGMILTSLFVYPIPNPIKITACIWSFSLLALTCFYWKKEFVNAWIVALVSTVGLITYYQLQTHLISPSVLMFTVSLLAGIILCLSLYAMNLGHFYLNVHGLPIEHLMRTTYVFWFFVTIRFLWDIFAVSTQNVMHDGEFIRLYHFFITSDGLLLSIAILFGTLLPLITLWLVKETLKLKNTQAATGILYVVLYAVIVGDMTYKYYLIKFGILL